MRKMLHTHLYGEATCFLLVGIFINVLPHDKYFSLLIIIIYLFIYL